MALKCPICDVEINEDHENVFAHLLHNHGDMDQTKLLLAILESLSEMNIDSYHRD